MHGSPVTLRCAPPGGEPAAGVPERTAALEMLGGIPGEHRITAGGDRGCDTRDLVRQCRELKITPHVAQDTARRGGSALDGRTTRYAVSLGKRKLIETTFVRAKQYGGWRRMTYRGRERASFILTLFNLLRISHLVPEPAG